MSVGHIQKDQIFDHCLQMAQKKHDQLQYQLDQLRESLSNETKSTAGDKHETGRAKLHFEIDQLNKQLNIVQNDVLNLHKIQSLDVSKKVGLGSLVHTNRGSFLIACGWGKLDITSNESIFSISVDAPLYQSMKGLSVGSQFKFNNNVFNILRIS